ncbi:Ankyrin repeat domain-containing protein 13C [Linum perenne]
MEDFSKYSHSPAHLAVARRDYAGLRRIISNLPRLAKTGDVATEEQSVAAEQKADAFSGVIDRRDVPGRETPLHLAVKLRDPISAEILMEAGADWSLQNENGWSALQEAVCTREEGIAMIIARHYQPLAWAKWCRRLPRIIASATRIRDFYMEITFHFESSVIPFIGRIAPSDTYRIWKRGANLRADMTLAGFDGFHIQRSDQTFLFLGDGYSSEDGSTSLLPGSLIVLAHKEKEITNALEGAGAQPTEAEVANEVALMSQTNMYRPDEFGDVLTPEERKQLDSALRTGNSDGLGDDEEHGGNSDCKENGSGGPYDNGELNGASKEKKSWFGWKNKGAKHNNDDYEDPKAGKKYSKLISEGGDQKSFDHQKSSSESGWEDTGGDGKKGKDKNGKKKKKGPSSESKTESEYKKGLRPVLWLTPDFPLQTDELLPLLDILANKVKAIRRLRELLTTKLPSGTFPVKCVKHLLQVAIPVVPTIRVMVTFTKFEDLRPVEEFSTPLSSPTHFQDAKTRELDGGSTTSWMSWMKGNRGGQSSDSDSHQNKDEVDPFHIPSDYKWVDVSEKKRRMKAKRAKTKKHREQQQAARSGGGDSVAQQHQIENAED